MGKTGLLVFGSDFRPDIWDALGQIDQLDQSIRYSMVQCKADLKGD